mmetsp:Transcript_23093/g.41222  ORF Transcript_23093/g.41222 Transcript_23093/m.41222 type:complete len:420 (-) Transcript_23093:384-1643(-)
MHDTTKPLPQILSSYPRGSKELRGLYTKRFTPDMAYDWFTTRGVRLKTEGDGRMFPITDNSQTIIDVISDAAKRSGVEVRMKEKVDSVEWLEVESDSDNNNDDDDDGDDVDNVNAKTNAKFIVHTSSKSQTNTSEKIKSAEQFDALVLATGSFPIGQQLARSLGHEIVKPVPSLFTLDAKDLVMADGDGGGIFHGLAGVSVPLARLTLVVNDEMLGKSPPPPPPAEEESKQKQQPPKKKRKRKKKAPSIIQEGPLLITHHGISGPAALRLSAFAAREFHSVGYKCDVKIHFCPKWEEEQRLSSNDNRGSSSEGILMDALWNMSRLIPKRKVATGCPLFTKESTDEENNGAPVIPKRLWSALVQHSDIPLTTTWGDVSKSMIRKLSENLVAFPLRVTSKGIFKEEFGEFFFSCHVWMDGG